MQTEQKAIGARAYLYKKNALIQKLTYVYEDGSESEPLRRTINLGMFTDSILFGEECQIRFFIYPNSLCLYDTDVDAIEFLNGSGRIVKISCFEKELILAPNECGRLCNTEKKKYRHN